MSQKIPNFLSFEEYDEVNELGEDDEISETAKFNERDDAAEELDYDEEEI